MLTMLTTQCRLMVNLQSTNSEYKQRIVDVVIIVKTNNNIIN
jgi:hypothetical protein